MTGDKKKICIVGAGGFGREIFCCLQDGMEKKQKLEDTVCFMVDDQYLTETKIMGVDVIPTSKFDASKYDVVVAVGDPAARKKIVTNLPPETTYTKIIHPSAVIS